MATLEIALQSRIQAEASTQTRQAASATLLLKLRDKLDRDRYAAITAAIEDHDQNYLLLSRSDGGKGGKFSDRAIERYLRNFEDVDIFWRNT